MNKNLGLLLSAISTLVLFASCTRENPIEISVSVPVTISVSMPEEGFSKVS